MSLEEFTRLAAMLVARGTIDRDEALTLITMFQAGDIDPTALPIPAATATEIPEQEEDDITIIAIWLSAGTSLAARRAARDARRAYAERQMDGLAAALVDTGNVTPWHTEMITATADYTRDQAIIGYGKALDPYLSGVAEERTRNLLHWLYLYAGAAAARELLARPYGRPYLANRSRHYLKRGWEMFYRAVERQITGTDGWVIDYIDRDDHRTCSPCRGAANAGPYLPGRGPYPGDVCEGGGLCRCERRRRWAPREALALRYGIQPQAIRQ